MLAQLYGKYINTTRCRADWLLTERFFHLASKEFKQPGNKSSCGQWLNAWQEKKNLTICHSQCKNSDTVSEDSKSSQKKPKSSYFPSRHEGWRTDGLQIICIHMHRAYAYHMHRAWNPVWKISAQLYSLRPSQKQEQVCLIKCWCWKGTSTDLHPVPYMADWSAQPGWGSPGSAPSLSGCRGYGYVNLCSTVRVCFVSALEVAGCQLQLGSDVALISMVPRGFYCTLCSFAFFFYSHQTLVPSYRTSAGEGENINHNPIKF